MRHSERIERYSALDETVAAVHRREAEEARLLHDRWPGRWPEWASPTRMRRDLQREREEDER